MNSRSIPRYFIFLSYSWADNCEPGRDWSDWLKEELEAFRIPQLFHDTALALGHSLGGNFQSIHQDKSEFRAGNDLTEAIRQNLDDSAWLLVLWSPKAAESKAVQLEIEYFHKHKRAGHIIYAVIDWPNKSVEVPRRATDENPLYVDFRWGESKKQGYCRPKSITGDYLKDRNDARTDRSDPDYNAFEFVLLDGVQQIAAAVLEVGPGAMRAHYANEHALIEARLEKQAAMARSNRTVAILLGLLLLSLLTILLWTGALKKSIEALRGERRGLQTEIKELTEQKTALATQTDEQNWRLSREDHLRGQHLLDEGNWDLGIAHLSRAARRQPLNRAALAHLWSAIAMTSAASASLPMLVESSFSMCDEATLSSDGKWLITLPYPRGAATLYQRDADTVYRKKPLNLPNVFAAAFDPDGSRLLGVSTKGRIWVDEISNLGRGAWIGYDHKTVNAAFWVPGRDQVVVLHDRDQIRGWSVRSNKPLGPPIRRPGEWQQVMSDSSGRFFAMLKPFAIFDLVKGLEITPPPSEEGSVWCGAFETGTPRLVLGLDSGKIAYRDLTLPEGPWAIVTQPFTLREIAFVPGSPSWVGASADEFVTGAVENADHTRSLEVESGNGGPGTGAKRWPEMSPTGRWFITRKELSRDMQAIVDQIDLWRFAGDRVIHCASYNFAGSPRIVFSPGERYAFIRMGDFQDAVVALPDEKLLVYTGEFPVRRKRRLHEPNMPWFLDFDEKSGIRVRDVVTEASATVALHPHFRSGDVFGFSISWAVDRHSFTLKTSDGEARTFPFGSPQTAPSWLESLVTAVSGMTSNRDGEFERRHFEYQLSALQQLRDMHPGSPLSTVGDPEWDRLLAWLLTEPQKRGELR
jgi:hypothetical protein